MSYKRPAKAVYRYLDTNGNGTGTKSAVGDYSSAAEEFKFTPTKTTELHRMIVSAEDTTGMQAQEYGNLGGALTNGITVEVVDNNGTQLLDMTDGVPVKTNAAWATLCYDADVLSWGSGNEQLVVRWTFTRAGYPLIIPEGYSLVVNLNDSFTGLLSHYFQVQGYEY